MSVHHFGALHGLWLLCALEGAGAAAVWLFELMKSTSGAESVLLYSAQLDHHYQASKLFCVYLKS